MPDDSHYEIGGLEIEYNEHRLRRVEGLAWRDPAKRPAVLTGQLRGPSRPAAAPFWNKRLRFQPLTRTENGLSVEDVERSISMDPDPEDNRSCSECGRSSKDDGDD